MATTYYLSSISLIVQYLTNLGLMAAGGQLYTYIAGTTTPVTTYTDSTGLTANPNPMTLSSTGRPQSTSGAPVAFWVPGGTTVKLIVTDASANQLVYLDNIPAINDLTNSTNALQALLASAASSNAQGSGPVAGADLVANAVKSYDIFADVRAANAPTLVSGQTLNIEVQGASTIGDGLGGTFYWSPTSTATDDSRTVLRPNTVASGSEGRWLRYYGLGTPQIVLKTADQQVASSTTLVNDTQLFAALAVVGIYLVRLRLQLLGTSSTGQGWKVATAFSGSLGVAIGGGGVVSGNGTASAVEGAVGGTIAIAAISDTTPDICNLDYTCQITATGTLTVQFAQDSSNSNPTIMKAGSMLEVTRLG